MDEYLAKGKRGEVFLRERGGKKVVVKKRNPDSDVDTIGNEARFTALCNGYGIGPAFISYDAEKGELVREYVRGTELRHWLPTAQKEGIRHVLLTVLDQCRTLDQLGINKLEMTRPWKHIIVQKDGEPMLIDFERCTATDSPKNVTQFCQFLSGTNLTAKIAEKGLVIASTQLLELAKLYKRNMKLSKKRENNSIYARMRAIISDA